MTSRISQTLSVKSTALVTV